jgi:hypothetical protein
MKTPAALKRHGRRFKACEVREGPAADHGMRLVLLRGEEKRK